MPKRSEPRNKIGQWLVDYCAKNGLTLEELAKRAGITPSNLAKRNRGLTHNLGYQTLAKLAAYTGTDLGGLFRVDISDADIPGIPNVDALFDDESDVTPEEWEVIHKMRKLTNSKRKFLHAMIVAAQLQD